MLEYLARGFLTWNNDFKFFVSEVCLLLIEGLNY